MTDASLLARVGRALYGERWQSDLARAVGAGLRTARHWSAGETEPRPGVYADLLALVRERRSELATIERDLRHRLGGFRR